MPRFFKEPEKKPLANSQALLDSETQKSDANQLSHKEIFELDLGEYCKAALEYKKLITSFSADKTNEAQKAQLKQKEEALLDMRKKYIDEYVSGLSGSMLWENYAQKFESALGVSINDSLVMEAMGNTFVEMLKNSMDSIIKSVLENKRDPQDALLQMEMMIDLDGEQLNLTIQDNSGGFPSAYLNKFDSMLKDRSYLSTDLLSEEEIAFASEKNELKNVFFGGKGMGLRMLYAMVLDGTELSRHMNNKKYEVLENQTSVNLENRKDGIQGALIRCSSPISPIKEHEFEYDDWPEVEDGSQEIGSFFPRGVLDGAVKESEVEDKRLNLQAVLEPLEPFLSNSTYLSKLGFDGSKLPAQFTEVECERLRSNLIQVLMEEDNKLNKNPETTRFADAIHKTLVNLAGLIHINDTDFLTLEEIPQEKSVVVSTGQKFNLESLIEYHRVRAHKSELQETANSKHLLNPYTNAPFSIRDSKIIEEVVREKKMEIPCLSKRSLSSALVSLNIKALKARGEDDTQPKPQSHLKK